MVRDDASFGEVAECPLTATFYDWIYRTLDIDPDEEDL